jgi:rRNA-processing protein FCF1
MIDHRADVSYSLKRLKDTRTMPMTTAIVNEKLIHIIESVRFALLDNRAKNR